MNAGGTAEESVTHYVLERDQFLAKPLEEVFEFFAEVENLERITPPWLGFSLADRHLTRIQAGTEIEYRLRLHGLPLRWVSCIDVWQPPMVFVDRQVRGPYRLWVHRHQFASTNGGTLISDRVRYALPLGHLGRLAHRLFVGRDLDRVFDFRSRAVRQLLG